MRVLATSQSALRKAGARLHREGSAKRVAPLLALGALRPRGRPRRRSRRSRPRCAGPAIDAARSRGRPPRRSAIVDRRRRSSLRRRRCRARACSRRGSRGASASALSRRRPRACGGGRNFSKSSRSSLGASHVTVKARGSRVLLGLRPLRASAGALAASLADGRAAGEQANRRTASGFTAATYPSRSMRFSSRSTASRSSRHVLARSRRPSRARRRAAIPRSSTRRRPARGEAPASRPQRCSGTRRRHDAMRGDVAHHARQVLLDVPGRGCAR